MFSEDEARKLGALLGLVLAASMLALGLFGLEASERGSLSWKIDNALVNSANYNRVSTSPDSKFSETDGKKVLVLGDSFVWGDGVVLKAQTWPGQFQELMREKSVEILQWGLNGAPTYAQIDWLESNPDVVARADLIVIGFVSNDPVPRDAGDCRDYWCYGIPQFENSEVFKSCFEGESRPEGWVANSLARVGLPGVASRYVDSVCNTYPFGYEADVEGQKYKDWVTSLYSERNLRIFRSELSRPGLVENKSKVVFLPTPVSPEDYETQRPALDVIGQEGFAVAEMITTLGYLMEPEAQTAVNPVNSHPGPALTSKYAEDLAQWLEHNGEGFESSFKGSRKSASSEHADRNRIWIVPDGRSLELNDDGSASFRVNMGALEETSYEIAGYEVGRRKLFCEKLGHPYLVWDVSKIDAPKSIQVAVENPFGFEVQILGIESNGDQEVIARGQGTLRELFPENFRGIIVSFPELDCELKEELPVELDSLTMELEIR